MPARTPGNSPRIPAFLPFAFIFALAFVAFWPSVAGGILWDDPAHLTITELQSWSGFWRILTVIGTTQEYYPGLHGAFWIEHKLWGDTLPAYHLLNIALHAASACLLALILRRLWTPVGATDARVIPAGTEWFAAALFAVHPVAVESVAWMTEQKNTLSVFFYLLAALGYLRYLDRRTARDYALATAAFVLALAAKTATLTLPPALLVVAWWRHGRLEWRRDVRPLLPWLALAVAAGLLTVNVETNYVGAKGAAYALSLGERAMLAARIVWFYVAKDFWPHDLLFFYPRWNVPAEAVAWWPYALAIVAVSVALVIASRRARGPLAAWCLFLGAMFPVIGFFNVFAFLFSYVADHFQYMPCLTFVAAVTGMVAYLANRGGALTRRLAAVTGGVAVVLFGLQTHRLSALYRNNETLFRHVIAENPDSWMAHQILGSALAKDGHDAEAMAQYRDVIRLKPDHPDAYLGLGVLLAKNPATKAQAIPLYEHALTLRPQYTEAHYALGVALKDDLRRRQEAVEHLEVSTGLQPYFAQGQVALATLLSEDRTRLPEALEHARLALKYHPEMALAHRVYADTLARSGAVEQAVTEYETALRLDPNDALTHFHLADVLAHGRARVSDAFTHYERALQLDPNLAEAHLHYGAMLAQQPGRGDDALREIEAGVRLAPRSPDAHNLLGILLVQRGDSTGARREWETALTLAPNDADARANLQRLDAMSASR